MSAPRSIRTVESHTEGMPTRIVVDGAPVIPGDSMAKRLQWAEQNLNDLRQFLMNEPRGHAAMFGAILMPATRADADHGVLFMSASGFLGMCGHGTIGVATVIVEKGLVKVSEPITEVRLDTPAGLVVAHVRIKSGKVVDVTFTNVPSFVTASNVRVEIPGVGSVLIDVAYGGNFYAILDVTQIKRDLVLSDIEDLMDLGLAVIASTREQVPIRYPTDQANVWLRAAILTKPASKDAPAKNLMVKEPRYFDRSPCGTGTSARMAMAYQAGKLCLDEPFIHESILGTRFEGRLLEATKVGDVPAVVPQIKGRAWITGTAEFTLDPSDPFPAGFKFGS
ncbi:MAG: proline racemase family protein [Proteobacteria bacterium]|nr:proline racemase family protein [Pseudomonadota bacterium]